MFLVYVSKNSGNHICINKLQNCYIIKIDTLFLKKIDT